MAAIQLIMLILCSSILAAAYPVETVAEAVCGSPGFPRNRLANGENHWPSSTVFPVGDVVEYTCPGELRLVGDATRVCQANGQWSGHLPACANDVVAGRLVTVDISSDYGPTTRNLAGLTDGSIQPDDSDCLLVNSQHTFHLNTSGLRRIHSIELYTAETIGQEPVIVSPLSHHITNETSPSIVFTGDWSKPRTTTSISITPKTSMSICEMKVFALQETHSCGLPESPARGSVQVISEQLARYECAPGYQLIGHETRSCEGTRWSHHQPICVSTAVADGEVQTHSKDFTDSTEASGSTSEPQAETSPVAGTATVHLATDAADLTTMEIATIGLVLALAFVLLFILILIRRRRQQSPDTSGPKQTSPSWV